MDDPRETLTPPSDAKETTGSKNKRPLILVIEDDDDTFHVVTKILGKEHFDIAHTSTGTKTMAWLRTNEPDLLLLDYRLPDMTGDQLIHKIRKERRSFPFVVMTAHEYPELAVRMMKLGALDYIIKDTTFYEVLRAKVLRAIEEVKVRKKLTQTQDDLQILKTALESAANAVVITDNQGHINWVNPAFTAMTGYEADEILGRTSRFLRSGHHSSDFYKKLWSTILARKVWQGEIVNRRKDGTLFQEEMTITPVMSEDGVIRHFIAIKHDITKRKETEKQVIEERLKYEMLFNEIADPILIFDQETKRFLDCNEAALQIYGYTRNELKNMTPLELHPIEEIGRVKGNISAPKTASANTYTHLTKDGKRLNVEIVTTAIECHGKPAWLSIIRDISDRVRMEVQLHQAQKLEAIGQLAAGIAHEVNTPIQYVGDNAHFLEVAFGRVTKVIEQNEILLQAAREHAVTEDLISQTESTASEMKLDYMLREIPGALKETLAGVKRVARIVLAMKEFSHPGGVEKTETNINKCLESTITVARNEWKYVADMEKDLDPSLPPVLCLPAEMNQVFLNLIVNAAHAIGDKVQGSGEKGRIKVCSSRQDDSVLIRISDTGGGIPEKIRSKIFDPFFTTKEVGRGTGQGLAIAYDVVTQKHGGDLSFDTVQGQGTTFTIQLPLNN